MGPLALKKGQDLWFIDLSQRRHVMHLKARHHSLAILMAIGLTGAFFMGGRVSAEPVGLQDATQEMTGIVDPSESTLEQAALTADRVGGAGPTTQAAGAAQGGLARADRARNPVLETPQTKAAPQNSTAAPSGISPSKHLVTEIGSTVKETVHPLRHQWVESGAVEVWKDLKANLGLDKSKWDTDGPSGANQMKPGRDGSESPGWTDAAQPLKTAAQAQVDHELATHMMEKLIDEIKPWAVSLLGLYLIGYMIKALLEHMQTKSIRRRKRETARALRRATKRTTRIKPEA